jgi:hypothetical protein
LIWAHLGDLISSGTNHFWSFPGWRIPGRNVK